MYFSFLFVSIYCIILIFGAPTNNDKIQQQLNDVLQKLNGIKLQFNKNIAQVLEKIDNSSHNIINLIKSSRTSQTDSNSQSTNRPVSALLIIDVQNDFINGSLALRNCPSKHNGEEVVPVINQLLDSINFDVVVYSLDWHPTNHISFFDNLRRRENLLTNDSTPLDDLHLYSVATFAINNISRMEQTLWPRHCVQNTDGAKLHSDLKIIKENDSKNTSVIHIRKGTNPDIDSYSAFWDNFKLSGTSLNKQLKAKNVTQVFVVGLATDWCVYSTALHSMEYGYKTFIIEDACRGVDEKTIKERLDDFKQKNGHIIQSNEVKDYIQ